MSCIIRQTVPTVLCLCLSIVHIHCLSLVRNDQTKEGLTTGRDWDASGASFPSPDNNRDDCGMEAVSTDVVSYICNPDSILTNNEGKIQLFIIDVISH